MLPLLTAIAAANSPFEPGPLEPLPAVPNDLTVLDGELVLISDDDTLARRATGWQSLGLGGGAAILTDRDGALVLCGPQGVVRHGVEIETLTQRPCRDLAPYGDDLWALTDDGVLRLPGEHPVTLDGPSPDRIGGTEQRVWVTSNTLHVDGVERLVFPGATAVASAMVRNQLQWLLLHPQRSLIGAVGPTGLEQAWTLPIPARVMAVGDLERDGRTEVIVASDDTWMALALPRPPVRLAPPSPPPPTERPALPARRRWEPPPSTPILGMPMPNFGGLQPDPEYDSLFIGGFGVVVGDALHPNQLAVGFSPAATGGVEYGARRIRSYFGADSAPLFIWSGSSTGLHLAMATMGVSIGSDRFRAGPFVSAGLLGAGAGLRTVFTPFESRAGKLTGFEARLTWFAPAAAHASLYYVSAFPLGARLDSDVARTERPSACHRFGMGAGGAFGVSSTALAWEFVGRDDTYQLSGSPAVTLACESGTRSTGWHIGAETAPFFFYRVPTVDGGADRKLHHAGSITLGAYVGGDTLRFGPIVTGGVWTLGGGARAVFTPIHTRGGAHHGVELRATALLPGVGSFQGMALWHVWFDPRADRTNAGS